MKVNTAYDLYICDDSGILYATQTHPNKKVITNEARLSEAEFAERLVKAILSQG